MKIRSFCIFAFISPLLLFSQKELKNVIIESNQAIIEHKKNKKCTEIIYKNQVKLQIEKKLSATMDELKLIINKKKNDNDLFFSFQKPSILYQEMALSADFATSKKITEHLIFYKNVLISQKLSTKKTPNAKKIFITTLADKAEISLFLHTMLLSGTSNKQVKTELLF